HAANPLFKHPDHVKRCYALSGIYDMRDSMDGMYDDNFYFNNPVDYMANQSDPWFLHQYASCDIRLVTGCGPWENSGPTYRMSEILRNRGIAHHLDDWGLEGGHEWPYWHHQMPRCMSKTFLSLCSKTWSRSDSPVSSFHANSRRQSGDRLRSRRSEKNTSALRRAAARTDLLKN